MGSSVAHTSVLRRALPVLTKSPDEGREVREMPWWDRGSSGEVLQAVRLNGPRRVIRQDPPSRTAAGYRVYGPETLATLAFVAQARRLGFPPGRDQGSHPDQTVGPLPVSSLLDLVRQKVAELDRTLADLTEVRRGLRELLRSSSRSARRGDAAICHIEHLTLMKGRR